VVQSNFVVVSFILHKTAPTSDVVPVGQARHIDCPSFGWYLFAGQIVHSSLPTVDLYLPFTQGTHAPVLDLDLPARHASVEEEVESPYGFIPDPSDPT
jgi:hypothetical protein